jgi:PAS domain S-box-containing protein
MDKITKDQHEKAGNDLRESESRYRRILEDALLGVYQVTLEGKFLYANHKLLDMMGFSSFEALSATVKIADCYARPEERDNIIKELLSKGFMIAEVELKRQDGEALWVKFHARKSIGSDGNTVFEGMMEDITTIREMKSRLHQSQKMETIGTLAGSISRHFNTILTSILDFTKRALDEVEFGSTVEDNLYEIYVAAERAKEPVTKLLAFAQSSDEEKKSVKISTIVNETIGFVRSTFPAKITIWQRIESDAFVLCNATQLYKALMNLYINAAQAVPAAAGTIEISLTDDSIDTTSDRISQGLNPGDYVRITVSDNGPGIPPDIIGSIFEPYFTTREVAVGEGLGLAQVHGIVESFGGKIFVESSVGTGSHFSIFLPAIKSPGIDLEKSESPSGDPAHILVVDDDIQVVKLYSEFIMRQGYRVTAMTSSREALKLFRKESASFDLVVSDMSMPDMNGDKLSTIMLEIRPDIPIILLTGYNKDSLADITKLIGAKAYAFKPIVLKELAEMIRKVIDDSRAWKSSHF